MLRRCSVVLLRGKGTHAWTAATSTVLSAPNTPSSSSRHGAAAAATSAAGTTHMTTPTAVAAATPTVVVDPATQRSSATTAKPSRSWSLFEHAGTATSSGVWRPQPSSWSARVAHSLAVYANLTRMDRPAGWQLLVIPCYWGASLAVTHALVWDGADPLTLCAPFMPPHLVLLFFAGAYLMRCAGCILNDLCDRRFDAHVARSAQRPLVRGDLRIGTAVALMFAHALLALPVLLTLSPAAVTTTLAIVPLTSVYALMKRYTYFPQVVLGVCYNWGIFVGYAAVLGRVDWAVCLPIYVASVVWVLLYDTIYAYQDRPYDITCGVKSFAVLLGERKYVLHWLIPPIAVGLTWSGVAVAQTLPYYLGIAASMLYLSRTIDHLNIHDAWSCGQAFRANVRIGVYILCAMFAGNVLWALSSQHEPEHDARQDSARGNSALLRHIFYAGSGDKQGDVSPLRYDAANFNWFDRVAHPIVVQAELAKASGATTPPPIPAWMRREYFGENVATLLRLCGASAATVHAWNERWYAASDQYNMYGDYKV